MSNLSSASSNSPKHSLGSFESASSDHPPSPPPNPMHPPILFPIHSLPPQVFIPEEVASFNWSDKEQEDSEELQLKAEEDVEDAATAAFKDALIRRKRRWRPSQSGSKSSASEPSNSKESDSSNSSSDGFSNSEDFEGEEEEEEEEEEDDEKEMEYQALDYPREDSGDNSDTYAPQSP